MKIKDGYLLREVAGTPVVVPLSTDTTFRNMLKLNGTGKFLWEKLLTGAERDELVSALLAEYEVEEARAAADVDAFLATLGELGVLEAE